MPMYEYICESCHARLEKLQKVSDPPLQECDVCKQPSLKKLMSLSGFRLSGGGWYETDFKDSDKKKNLVKSEEAPAPGAAKTDSPATTPSTGGVDKPKVDSKPETKVESTKDSSNTG